MEHKIHNVDNNNSGDKINIDNNNNGGKTSITNNDGESIKNKKKINGHFNITGITTKTATHKMNETTSNQKMEKQSSYDDSSYFRDIQTRQYSSEFKHEDRNREFIRKLANDFIHYKIHGRSSQSLMSDLTTTTTTITTTTKTTEEENHISQKEHLNPFRKTANTLRKVSMEMERTHTEFFDKVCENLRIREENAEQAFKIVSEEVLDQDSLNWGRVVSLFTFGGKLAEWFWKTQQEEKIDELEDWLTDSLSNKEIWIEKNGGWEGFNETFPVDKQPRTYNWIKPSIILCAGVSLAAVLIQNYGK